LKPLPTGGHYALYRHGADASLRSDGPDAESALAPKFFKEFQDIPVENSGLASLITQSWNPLMEWLRRLASLRDTLDFPALAVARSAVQAT
jgi:hypothetical protein